MSFYWSDSWRQMQHSLTNCPLLKRERSFSMLGRMIYHRWCTWGKWLCYGVILFHFIMQMCVGGKVNRKKMHLSSFLRHKICFHYTPCPPLPLVAYSATPSTIAYRTVRTFQWWCDGWHGDCRLPAHPLVTWGPPLVETEPGVWWHLAFYCKNYASVLTFSLMHKIHDVCGTSCRHCSR